MKSVSFSESIHVREHAITLGDHPSVLEGPPVTLEWQVQQQYSCPRDVYERFVVEASEFRDQQQRQQQPCTIPAAQAAGAPLEQQGRMNCPPPPPVLLCLQPRQQYKQLRLSPMTRYQMLTLQGHSSEQIEEAIKAARKVRQQRIHSYALQDVEPVCEAWQSVTHKIHKWSKKQQSRAAGSRQQHHQMGYDGEGDRRRAAEAQQAVEAWVKQRKRQQRRSSPSPQRPSRNLLSVAKNGFQLTSSRLPLSKRIS